MTVATTNVGARAGARYFCGA
eukprot:SAG31_NODE_22900_length_515_cov_4.425481_1_plen_20_part_01